MVLEVVPEMGYFFSLKTTYFPPKLQSFLEYLLIFIYISAVIKKKNKTLMASANILYLTEGQKFWVSF